jgi:hypothetical protein
LQGFNKEIEEIVRVQSAYAVPDTSLKHALRQENAEHIVPKYQAFFTKYVLASGSAAYTRALLAERKNIEAYHRQIEYGCEDGRFPLYASRMTISNPDLLSSSETGVSTGIRS